MTATLFPYRFEQVGRRYLFSNDAGDFFLSSPLMLERMVEAKLMPHDEQFLLEKGFAFETVGDFHYNSFLGRLRQRKAIPSQLSYIIAIPTLRCDLACRYCQVSRAHRNASGFDWSEATTRRFLQFLDGLPGQAIVIEFQGGEPTLRLDIVEQVIRFCERRFDERRIIVCSNLGTVSHRLLDLLERPEVTVSTSLDGPTLPHSRNRGVDAGAYAHLLEAIASLRARYGPNKIGALPTITPGDYGRIGEVVDTYVRLGFGSVFLRPVSFHGFARKAFGEVRSDSLSWQLAYRRALDYIFDLNATGQGVIFEYGLEVALKRLFLPAHNGHVDLRSPNPAARDYVVVDHDGRLYPSDEARMLARVGRADLSIGSLERGLDRARAAALSWNQLNEAHEDCIHCAFQPYCGIDIVDDLARYGRTDNPKHLTWYCRSNAARFRMIFEMLLGGEPRDLLNLAGHLVGKLNVTPFFGPIAHDPA